MKKLFKNKKGFTLVELMVVVAILGILVAVAIPVYNSVTDKAEAGVCHANARTLDSAVMQYKTLVIVPQDGEDFSDDVAADTLDDVLAEYMQEWPVCPDGGTYSYDAGTGRVICSIHGDANGVNP